MKTRNIVLWVIVLVIIDQVIKLIINSLMMGVDYEIIPSTLNFKPTFNSKYSFVNVLLYNNYGINMGLIFHVVLFALIWVVIFVLYKFYKNIAPNYKMLDVAIIFQSASYICAYLGILFWSKGMLDYIHLKPLSVVFDLKDIYVNCFIVLWVISTSVIAAKYHVTGKDYINYFKKLFDKRK